jgi:HlyD family secretion protein
MKRIITRILIAIIVVGAIAGAVYYFKFSPASTAASSAANPAYQTAVVKRGALTATISATGSVRAEQTANLTWSLSAKVGEVKVVIGQQVKKDDILAVLDPTSLPQSLLSAQASLISAQNALQTLYDNAGVQKSQAEQALALAQKALDDAQTRRYWVDNPTRADEFTIQKAEGDYYLALQAVSDAQDAYDSTSMLDISAPERAAAQSALGAAQERAQQLKWMLDYYRGAPDTYDVSKAEAALQVAKAAVDNDQRTYDEVKNGPKAADIALAQSNITMFEAAAKMAHLDAPFDGTVTNLDVLVGDIVAPGTFAMRIDNLSALYVDLQVSEVDINHIQIGQPSVLTFDAASGQTYNGKVTDIGRAGTTVGGVVNFPVTVQLLDADNNVKPGMTAGAVITISQLSNVLMVPSRAVRTVSGKRVVYILDSKQALVPVIIEIGSQADTMVEVTKGNLKEGDVVVVNPPSNPFGNMQGGPNGGSGTGK